MTDYSDFPDVPGMGPDEWAAVEATLRAEGALTGEFRVDDLQDLRQETVAQYLRGTPELRMIERAMYRQAIEYSTGPFDRHLLLTALGKSHYKDRKVGGNYEQAIECARDSIAIQAEALAAWRTKFSDGPPSHWGYKQLSIIEESRGNLDEALRLVNEGEEAGWWGDWEKRRTRLEKKLDRK